MKQTFLSFLLMLLPMLASAVDFTDANGIIYELGGKGSMKVAKVKGTTEALKITGVLNIPATVNDGTDTYTVTTICNAGLSSARTIYINESDIEWKDGLPYYKNNYLMPEVSGTGTTRYYYYEGTWNKVVIPATITVIEENACMMGDITTLDVEDLESWCNITITSSTPSSDNVDTWIRPKQFSVKGVVVKDLVIPSSITSISKVLFKGFSCFESVTIPGSVETIGDYAFCECRMSLLSLGEGIKTIGKEAFSRCSNLTAVTIPKSYESYTEGSCFQDCTQLSSVVVKGAITAYMFNRCSNLTSVILDTKSSQIGGYAFQGTAISSIIIPSSISYISNYAFYNCSNLKTVTIKRDVNGMNGIGICGGSFANCPQLENFYCEVPFQNIRTEYGNPFENSYVNEGATLHVPSADVASYQATDPWSQFTNIVALNGGNNGDDDDNTYVDLGLPSGTKWATMNVGATNPEDPGDIFAWAETDAKTSFTENNYKYGTSLTDMTKYNSNDGLTVLEAGDDAATANMGADWRTPTVAEWRELRDKCTRTWMTVNGKTGYQFTGPNGNKIFLPCGFDNFWGNGAGYYWSSSLSSEYVTAAWNVDFDKGGFYIDHKEPTGFDHRYTGRNIRAVYGNTTVTPPTQKCATPTISYSGGKLRFTCETPDVEFFYDISSADDKNGKGSEVDVTPVYHINVYASKEGYLDSDVASADINMACEDSQSSPIVGDLNGDGKVNVADHVELSKIILNQ